GRRRKQGESARRRPAGLLRSWSDSEDDAQALAQLALLAAAFSGDEYGVVAGDRADDLRPARVVDGDRDALRRAGRGLDDRQRRTGGPHFHDEVGNRGERRAGCRAGVAAGQDVVVAGLGDALLAQELRQLVLVVHGRLADDPEDRRAPRHRLMNLSCHLIALGAVCIKTRACCINMQTLSRIHAGIFRARHSPSAAYSASAVQISTNPATRGPLNGSPNANTASISWIVGPMYCRSPTVE